MHSTNVSQQHTFRVFVSMFFRACFGKWDHLSMFYDRTPPFPSTRPTGRHLFLFRRIQNTARATKPENSIARNTFQHSRNSGEDSQTNRAVRHTRTAAEKLIYICEPNNVQKNSAKDLLGRDENGDIGGKGFRLVPRLVRAP